MAAGASAEPTGPAAEPHRAREIAESFGADPESYHRARPRYPSEMVEAVLAASPGRRVLDVGLGTGISARQFQAAGCDVLGVEVDGRMAGFARRAGLSVEVAKFEEWEAAGRIFDLVIAGQAWHWVDPVAGPAKAATVLRPGGRLAPFWNVFELPAELREGLDRVHHEVLGEAPFLRGDFGGIDAYLPQFERTAAGMAAGGYFAEPERWHFPGEHRYEKEEWLDQVATYGGYNRLDPADLARLLEGLGRLIDQMGGAFTMSYATVVVTATRSLDD